MIYCQLLTYLGFAPVSQESMPFHPHTLRHTKLQIRVIYYASTEQIGLAKFIHGKRVLDGEMDTNKTLLDMFLECYKEDLQERAHIVFEDEEE